MIELTIPRPPYGTPKIKIAKSFGVTRVTLNAADRRGDLIRTARTFTLRVRSAGTVNVLRPRTPRVRCQHCGKPLTMEQQARDRDYCGIACANTVRRHNQIQSRKQGA